MKTTKEMVFYKCKTDFKVWSSDFKEYNAYFGMFNEPKGAVKCLNKGAISAEFSGTSLQVFENNHYNKSSLDLSLPKAGNKSDKNKLAKAYKSVSLSDILIKTLHYIRLCLI